MKNLAKSLVLVVLLFATPSQALAWSARGHMVVAAVAFRNLPAATQQQLTALLRRQKALPSVASS